MKRIGIERANGTRNDSCWELRRSRKFPILAGICGVAGLVYACGGATTTLDDGGGVDSGNDSTTGNDSGGSDTGTSDTGVGDGGCGDACASFNGDCPDGGCPANNVCVTRTAGPSTTHQCYPLPTCCSGKPACECIGTCACGNEQCQQSSGGGGISCLGPVSKREFKTDIAYVDEAQRAELAEEALQTRLAEYRYKNEPEGAKRHLGFIIDDMPESSPAVGSDATHVDLYGYTTMLLATVQEQQRQIDELKKQVDTLKKKH